MFKELLVLAVFVGFSSAKVIAKSENGVKKRGLYSLEDTRALPKNTLEDAVGGDPSIFDEKRATDFDRALSFYDYITDFNKKSQICHHFFPIFCPRLAKSGYCTKGKKGKKARFAARYCSWACGAC